jgi:uncharacterized protein YukE
MAPGFRMNTQEVDGHAKTACELAEQLRSARTTWDGATRDGGDACGMDVTSKAYTAMQDAWFDEIEVYIKVLEQLCEAMHTAAQQSSSDDTAATQAFTRGTDVQ